MRKAQDVFAKEEVIAAIIEEEGRLEKRLREDKVDGEDQLKKLDFELLRMDRKEISHEQARIEQLDNVERKIEYERHKNQKIEALIQADRAKIEKIKDSYKDRNLALEVKLEEMEKDLKFA